MARRLPKNTMVAADHVKITITLLIKCLRKFCMRPDRIKLDRNECAKAKLQESVHTEENHE